MVEVSLPSGGYPIELRQGEVERLRLQDRALAPFTEALLDEIGVADGWRCLDLGCGPGGITGALAARAGSSGRVVGLDYNADFVEIARGWGPKGVTYMAGNAYATGLPAASFDLVHMRFLASTAGDPGRLIAEAMRLARPGGVVAMQESDFTTLRAFPANPAFDRLAGLLADTFPDNAIRTVAQGCYARLKRAGLQDVGYRPCLVGTRAGDPWCHYLPETAESVRGTITSSLGLDGAELDRLIAECRRHLDDPLTVTTSFTCVQVWGRLPG